MPHSVFLVILGGVAGFAIRGMNPVWAADVVRAFPDVILYVLLPPLVFESAYNMDVSDLRKDIVPIMTLAVISLVLSAIVIGLGMSLALGIPLLACLLFGALMSATDPVAVVALFKELGAPKRLNMLIEGESLFNDGSAIVLFQVLLAAALAPAMPVGPSMIGTVAWKFIWIFFGGILVGLVLAALTSLFLKWTPTGSGQMGLTVAAAYLSFIVADHLFHVSGVMSTVAVGIYLGNRARLEFNKEAMHGMHFLWEFLALAANIIVFFGVGLTVEPGVLRDSLKYIPAALVIVYAARAVSVFLVVPVLNRVKGVDKIPLSYQAMLVWGGLRGGLALALVLLLSPDFAYKQIFLGLATSVVLATLLINALTIKSAMRRFGLDQLTDREEGLFSRTVMKLRQIVYQPLQEAASDGSLSVALIEKHKRDAEAVLKEFENPDAPADDGFDFEFRNLMLTEKAYYDRRLEDAVLSKPAYRRLIRRIQRRFEAYWHGHEKALFDYPFHLLEEESKWIKVLSILTPNLYHKIRVRRLTKVLEECLHMRFAIHKALRYIEHKRVQELGEIWMSRLSDEMHRFFELYPNYGTSIQALFIANSLAATSEKTLDIYRNLNLITGGVYARAVQYVRSAHDREVENAKAYLNPSTVYLLKHVSLFQHLPESVMAEIAAGAKIHDFPAGVEVVREGEHGESIFLVVSGLLGVSGSKISHPKNAKLFAGDYIGEPQFATGDFFGEMSLLLKSPRSATVRTISDATLIEITYAQLEKLMTNFPEVRRAIESVGRQRMSGQPKPVPAQ